MGYSLAGEEQWILSHYPLDYHGFAVELGAADGHLQSNTMGLEERGWTCLCIEPNPHLETQLRARRKLVWMGACADFTGRAPFHINVGNPCAFSSLAPITDHPTVNPGPGAQWDTVEVAVDTLDNVLDAAGFTTLDVASIDTDSDELVTLKGFNLERWQPKLIVIETWDQTTPVEPYLNAHGYQRVERRNWNDLYIRCPPTS